MSAEPDRAVVELTAEQMLTVRGATNAILDAVDDPNTQIGDLFDPIRREHAAAAGDELGEALVSLSPEGTWRGRMPPSEVQALRDAVGALETMVTPPMSERLLTLGYRPDDADLDNLAAARDGLPAPDREDLAFSDFRFGGYDPALESRTNFEELTDSALGIIRGSGSSPDELLDRLTDRTFPPEASCPNFDLAIVDLAATAAVLAGGTAQTRSKAIDRFDGTLDDALTAGGECYGSMDARRIRAGAARLTEALDRRDKQSARAHALGVAEMVAWSQSNRLREQRIGLR